MSNIGAGQPGSALSRHDLRGILFGAAVAMFLAALDQTIVAPALPAIARDLGEFNAISWLVTAYLLSSTAVTPIFGKLSDLYGRRRLLLAGLAIFIAGSIACALAPSMVALIMARALQGIGGGALITLPNAIIGDVVPPRERGRYQGFFASVFALSSIAGPVLGGLFTERLSWTLIFWINVPLGLLAVYVSARALARLPVVSRPHRIDYLGSLLIAAATVSFLLAVTWGGHRYPWLSLPIAALLLATLLLGILFILRQRMAEEPILPLSLLANPTIRLTSLIGLLLVMLNIGVSVYVPLFLELARGMGAGTAGLVLIAPMISVVGGALIAGQYMRFVGSLQAAAADRGQRRGGRPLDLGAGDRGAVPDRDRALPGGRGHGSGDRFSNRAGGHPERRRAARPRDRDRQPYLLPLPRRGHRRRALRGDHPRHAAQPPRPGSGIGPLRRPDRHPASGRTDGRRPAPGRRRPSRSSSRLPPPWPWRPSAVSPC